MTDAADGPVATGAPIAWPEGLVLALHRLTWNLSSRRTGADTQDRLLRALVARQPFARLMVVDHPSSAPVTAVRRLTGRHRGFPATARQCGYTPLRLRRRDPAALAPMRRTYEHVARRLRVMVHRAGLERPLVLTTNPLLPAFGDLSWASSVTYYGVDDFAVGNPRLSPVYTKAYEALRETDCGVVTVTDEILRRVATSGPTLVLPNGVEADEWQRLSPAPAWVDPGLPRPLMVYVGALTDRMDVGIVERLADAFPCGSLVFFGVLREERHFASVASRPNVHMHRTVDRRTVTSIIAAADVGLVPHVVNEVTRAMSPLKGYEYLAAGIPVVSTDLPEMRRLGSRVLIRGAEDFVSGVREALDLGRASEAERLAFVAANSWESRHDLLWRFVRRDLAGATS